MFIHPKQPSISKKNDQKCFVSKWQPKKKTRIFVSQKSHVTKIWKTTFLQEFLNKMWLVQEHEDIYIFEIQFENNKNGSQNQFCDIAQ